MRAKLLLLFIALAFVFSCGEDALQRTQVLLIIDGGSGVKAMTERLEVALKSGPIAKRAMWKTHDPETFTKIQWPASLALVPKADAGDTGFEVAITAYNKAGSKVIENRVISSFIKLRTLLLEVVLDDACIDHFDCGQAETCDERNGMPICQTATVNPKELPEYTGPGKNRDDDDFTDAGRHDAGGDGDGDGDGDGPCVASGAEQCFNGKDDDCNGETDCADSACDPTSMCVPGGPSAGVMVGKDDPCPEGYTASEKMLHRDLKDGGCEGCTCNITPTTCTAALYTYGSSEECSGDVNNQAGTLHYITQFYNEGTQDICPNPLDDSLGGWRVTTMVPTDGSCQPQGTSVPAAAAWAESGKLCSPPKRGRGCAEGQVCVPKVANARTCHQDAVVSCADDVAAWYESFEDDRSCGSCRCTDGAGGNCAAVKVAIGHDWSCGGPADGDGLVGINEKGCADVDGNGNGYAPPVYLVGAPINKSCTPTASTSGSLKPTGRVDLCCTQL